MFKKNILCTLALLFMSLSSLASEQAVSDSRLSVDYKSLFVYLDLMVDNREAVSIPRREYKKYIYAASAKGLKERGASAKELKDAGFEIKELRMAQFNEEELAQAGFNVEAEESWLEFLFDLFGV